MNTEKTEMAAVKVLVHGRVQAVGFRFFTIRQANELGLTGYVRNLENGTSVECVAEGEKGNLEKLVSRLKEGPRFARVEKIETSWSGYSGAYPDFSSRP